MSDARWPAGLRRGLVRDLLRPIQLARDVEGGWIGDLLGRVAWAELRLPLLAAWTARWSADDDELPELPIVHARPLPDAPEPATTGVPVQAVVAPSRPATAELPAAAPPAAARLRPLADVAPTPTNRSAPAPAHARGEFTAQPPAAPRVHPGTALPVTTAPATAAPPATGEHPGATPTTAAPDAHASALPARPRRPVVELPRVVAAFRPDLAGRVAAAAPVASRPTPSPDPLAPAGPAGPVEPAPRRTPRAAVTVETIADDPAGPVPLVHVNMSESPGPDGHPLEDMSLRTSVDPAPARADLPPVAAAPPPVRATPAGARPPELVPAAPRTARPAASAPAAQPSRGSHDPGDMSHPPPAGPRLRAAMRPVADAPARARGRSGGTSRPALVAAAAWSGADPLPDLARAPAGAPVRAAATPRTDLPHAPAPAAAPTAAFVRPTASAGASPVPTDIHPAPPPPGAAPPTAPSIDIEALVDTVKRSLARDLARARELRRAIR